VEEEDEEALFVAEVNGSDGDDDASVVGGEDSKREMSKREMVRSRGSDGRVSGFRRLGFGFSAPKRGERMRVKGRRRGWVGITCITHFFFFEVRN